VIEDADGRVIDLHALRTTLGTQLARAGVAPQIAQRIMRHSDYKTTLRHYTILGLTDTAAAMDRLPGVGTPETERQAATGTHDATPAPAPVISTDDPQRYPQQLTPQLGRGGQRRGAATHVDAEPATSAPNQENIGKTSPVCDQARHGATLRIESSGRNSMVECQPSKRTPYVGSAESVSTYDNAQATPSDSPSKSGAESPADPELARLVAAWPDLPPAIRAGILAMVKASGQGE